MKIIQLVAENVKRLVAVDIKPDDSLVVVGGKNDQGKSSVLDSIMYALAGGQSLPPVPLRNGEKKGHVTITLDDMTVTRRFTRKTDGDVSTSLEIKRPNGDKVTSPQALLDSLCGKLAFDPLEFSRLKPKEQVAQLKALVGLDFSELDEKRSKYFETRTDCNRAIKSKQAELAACPEHPDVPDAIFSIAELTGELLKREKHNRANDFWKRQIDEHGAQVKKLTLDCEDLEERIAELQDSLKQKQQALASATQKRDQLSRITLKYQDCDEIREKMKQAESTNIKVRENEQRRKISAVLDDLTADAASLTEKIEAIDKQKAKLLAEAPFPVPGLGFAGDGVTLNGLPLEQASTRDRIRLSVAMGLALNPKLRVMLIREGSLLFDDENGLQLIGQMAEQADAQVWVERVSLGSECSVIIEDGHVKGDAEAEHTEASSVGT